MIELYEEKYQNEETEELVEETLMTNRIFARVDSQSVVTHIFSDAFEQPTEQDICIDSVNIDRHGANAYQVYDENGIANYEIVNGKLMLRDKSVDIRQIQIDSYPSLVESKIRLRYSISDELAILRQRNNKPEEYEEYDAYCELCKMEARNELKIGG